MEKSLIQKEVERAFAYLEARHGIILEVDVEVDYEGDYPRPRDFAKTSGDVIYFSPKILSADVLRLRGLLYHEIAHALLMREGDYDHSEAYADQVAEFLFNTQIFYDSEGVQTLAGGTRPRPLHLPQ